MSTRSLALALAVLALLAVAPLAGAQTQYVIDIQPVVQTYNTTISVPVLNQTISMAANSTQTINITVPGDGWDYMLVVIENASAQVSLTASYNGSQVFSGSITPLATGPTVITMPIADTITLAAQNAWSGLIVVYVNADLQFEVTVQQTKVTAAPGERVSIPVSVRQTAGPAVYTWWEFFTDAEDAPFTDYRATTDAGSPWYKDPATFTYYTIMTTGAGWTKTGTLSWLIRNDAQPGTWAVTIYLKASTDNPENPNAPIATVATVDLTGTLSDGMFEFVTNDENSKWLSAGVGVIVGLVIAMLVLGKGGRRGTANGMAPVVLILVALAAVGLTAGLIDFNATFDIDPKYLGIGILAILALVMLVKQGAVPAPKPIQRFFK